MAFISMKYKLNMAAIAFKRFLNFSKYYEIFYRNFSINLGNNLGRHARQTEEETHVYKQKMSNRDVIDYLVKNVTFENEDWIVTNKPYGVGWTRPSNLLTKYSARTFNDVYLEEILFLLAQDLNVQSLNMIFIPERFTSGVTILGKTTESVEKFKKYHLMNLKRTAPQYGFVAVTLFEPVSKTGEKKFKIQYDKDTKSIKVTEAKKNSQGIKVFCKHEVLDSSKFCSLVKVEVNKVIHNCVSEYLEKACLSPILGEQSFNLSVSKLCNVSFPVVAYENVRHSKNVDPELMSRLKLQENEIGLIPKHLHLKSFTLKIGKKEEFFASAPLPESFLWTCDRLNLSLNKIVS